MLTHTIIISIARLFYVTVTIVLKQKEVKTDKNPS